MVLETLKGHSSSATSVAFSPNSKQAMSGSRDNTVQLWDAVAGAALQILKAHLNSVTSVAFSPDGKQVVSRSEDNTEQLWDTATGTALQTLEGHSSSATSVAFLPDGKVKQNLFILNDWAVEDNRELIWLPPEYQGTTISVWKRIIVLGHSSGRISILGFKDGSKYI